MPTHRELPKLLESGMNRRNPYDTVELERATLYRGDCVAVLPLLGANYFTACVCDPPYHLAQARSGNPHKNDPKTTGFMGKTWDGGDIAFRAEFWAEVLRVLKPGAMLLAFGGTRTFHRLTCAIEDGGFEVRDCLVWMYGSGFPKSLSVSKAMDKAGSAEKSKLWRGWGTALKPAWEPIVLAMKPLDGTFAHNAVKHGVAGLNVDASRIGAGRWPANAILDELLDRQTGILKSGKMKAGQRRQKSKNKGGYHDNFPDEVTATGTYGDAGGASRFFYCARANKKDRTCNGKVENNHPTVKPRSLMEYLCRLVTPPGGGIILDPFMGSGSTGIAASLTGNHFVGIELENESFAAARRRIEASRSDV